jgi:type II secretory pathway component PulJ
MSTLAKTVPRPVVRQRSRAGRSGAAFTLMEMLLALGTSAIVLAGIGGVFFSAMRLRERTLAVVDEAAPLHHTLTLLRRDLQCARPPGSGLAGDFISGPAGSAGLGATYWLQFSTGSGWVSERAYWGDVQEVFYELRPSTRGRRGSSDLVRAVTRNLLPTGQLEEDAEVLLENVESFEVSCFDGMQWRDTWDTSLYETNLPLAVRIRLLPESPEGRDTADREPIELVFPLTIQPRTSPEGEAEPEQESP